MMEYANYENSNLSAMNMTLNQLSTEAGFNSGYHPAANLNMNDTTNNYVQHMSMKVANSRPSFKGSLEDLVMITNFKRFKRKGSTSKYKGVFFVKKEKKYRAQICLKGKKKYVGTFKNDRDAAIARDKKIREMFGEVEELLNFPLSKANINNDDQDQLDDDQSNSNNDQDNESYEPIQHQMPPKSLSNNLSHGFNADASQLLSNLTAVEDDKFMSMRNRLSTLSRYGSSQSSWMNFNTNGGNFNDQQHNHQQYTNHLLNFNNLQEIALPRSRTMLTKRFSSNDSCNTAFSLNLNNDVYTPSSFNPGYNPYNNSYTAGNNNYLNAINNNNNAFIDDMNMNKAIKTNDIDDNDANGGLTQ